MIRVLGIVLSCSMMLAQPSQLATSWMPLELGACWELVSPDGAKTTLDCVATGGDANGTWFAIERRTAKTLTRERWAMRDTGLWRSLAAEPGPRIDPWRAWTCLLPLPAGVSLRWEDQEEITFERSATPRTIAHRGELVSMDETLDTPSGKLRALRVVITSEGQRGTRSKTTLWFARGLGLVGSETETEVGGDQAPQTLRLVRHLGANAPLEPDLLQLVTRTLQQPRLAARGQPVSMLQVRHPVLRESFASRFVRVRWGGQTLLLRELAGRVTEFAPLASAAWNQLLDEEGQTIDCGRSEVTGTRMSFSPPSSDSIQRLAKACVLLCASTRGDQAQVHHSGDRFPSRMMCDSDGVTSVTGEAKAVGRSRDGERFEIAITVAASEGKMQSVQLQ